MAEDPLRVVLYRAGVTAGPFRRVHGPANGSLGDAASTFCATEDVEIIQTPYQAPKANAVAERWIRSVREECLDQLLILNARNLQRVLTEYVTYSNHARPHQGINQQCPMSAQPSPVGGPIQRRNVLGGIIHDYYREAA